MEESKEKYGRRQRKKWKETKKDMEGDKEKYGRRQRKTWKETKKDMEGDKEKYGRKQKRTWKKTKKEMKGDKERHQGHGSLCCRRSAGRHRGAEGSPCRLRALCAGEEGLLPPPSRGRLWLLVEWMGWRERKYKFNVND